MAAQQQSLESLLGISGQRKSLKQQLDAASIKTEAGRTTLADLPTRVQIHDTPRHICEYGVDMDAD
jgi:hypothetical protein